jgi:hypothetical protein
LSVSVYLYSLAWLGPAFFLDSLSLEDGPDS